MITKKAAYMAVGIDLDSKKDVLGIWIGENESAKFWLSVLNELRNRGVQGILIICVDNLAGFSEAITACYLEVLTVVSALYLLPEVAVAASKT